MAAGLGFKDFTTGEVLTANDVDGYLMQGVWVFASAAARDAAGTSTKEGNFAYLKDTNVTTYYTGSAWANLDTTGMTNPMTTTGDTIYSSSGSTPARLGIGSTGQVLTVAGGVPSWATVSAGGMTLLSTTTLSGASTTVTISDFTYVYLRVFIIGGTWSGSCNIQLKPNGSSTLATCIQSYWTGSVGSNGTSASTIQTGLNNNNGSNVCALELYNYSSTTKFKPFSLVHGSSDSGGSAFTNAGAIQTNSQISSLVFETNTTTSFTGGTVTVYGVK